MVVLRYEKPYEYRTYEHHELPNLFGTSDFMEKFYTEVEIDELENSLLNLYEINFKYSTTNLPKYVVELQIGLNSWDMICFDDSIRLLDYLDRFKSF